MTNSKFIRFNYKKKILEQIEKYKIDELPQNLIDRDKNHITRYERRGY